MEINISERIFTEDDQQSFAALSGDWNPVHVEEEIARRTIVGSIVIHGIHGVLWALYSAMSSNHITNTIKSIQVKFHSPIKLNEIVECFFLEDKKNNEYKLIIRVNKTLKTTIVLSFCDLILFKDIPNRNHLKSLPKEYFFNKVPIEKHTMQLYFDKLLYMKMFPSLENKIPDAQIALLLGISNIIGMECPGNYSLFSNFNISWHDSSNDSVDYQISNYNERFSSIKLSIKSGGATGELQSFIRPASVKQNLTESTKKYIPKNIFSKWRVLVIGGSRGLGEASTKILTHGGAKSCITYYKGLNDAKKIAKETSSGILYLDILSDCKIDLEWSPTHLFYFPTPNITSEDTSFDSDSLLELYHNYFVKGFEKIIKNIYSGHQLKVFYPSTYYIDHNNDKYKKYSEIKMQGEELCKLMNKLYPNIDIFFPRLPRLKTDLTASLTESNSIDPIPYLSNLYKNWK